MSARLLATVSLVVAWGGPIAVHAEPRTTPAPTLADYRHFRALSIDLAGRAPRREELAALERPDFRWEPWIDRLLGAPGYVDRMVRIYMDLLRLEVGPAVAYTPPSVVLRRVTIKGPEGKPLHVYYRQGQRRRRGVTDGEFCLSEEESGLRFPNPGFPEGTPRPVPARVLEENTVVVKPWWLYRDFEDEAPSQWIPAVRDPDPLFQPLETLLEDADGGPTVNVRVCREEAQVAETGKVFVADRPPVGKGPPPGRLRNYPIDDDYARGHRGEPISCRSAAALTMSLDCGCGPGLRHCLPGEGGSNNPRAFVLPTRDPLGGEQPLQINPQTVAEWHRFWWNQEARRFLASIFEQDRDLREILTGRHGMVNGPVAEFYRAGAPASCCNREKIFGMVDSTEPLVDPHLLPDIAPWDTRSWRLVPDRGPHAAGLVTLPAFLAKYASRRARAAALYTTFTCKSFVASKDELGPSKEPDLAVRPGCSSCHATLEPLAAYFARIEEANWTFLPAWRFPVLNLRCRKNARGEVPGYCLFFYDPDFSDREAGVLRGAHASVEHAAAGAAGAALALTSTPEFDRCAVERITSSFLGRPLTSDDDPLLAELGRVFATAHLHPRALVRAIVTSEAYRQAAWREPPSGEKP